MILKKNYCSILIFSTNNNPRKNITSHIICIVFFEIVWGIYTHWLQPVINMHTTYLSYLTLFFCYSQNKIIERRVSLWRSSFDLPIPNNFNEHFQYSCTAHNWSYKLNRLTFACYHKYSFDPMKSPAYDIITQMSSCVIIRCKVTSIYQCVTITMLFLLKNVT